MDLSEEFLEINDKEMDFSPLPAKIELDCSMESLTMQETNFENNK